MPLGRFLLSRKAALVHLAGRFDSDKLTAPFLTFPLIDSFADKVKTDSATLNGQSLHAADRLECFSLLNVIQ
ncbi:Uncharacterized protein APZ42_022124 [Daphnia magna]|uniref:Uncharacterized protein n=1 Tax=Daphnia magna TaxID=35525 RepID=A0A164W2A8_9CRUS|nr:Uncharacterized protein APZ42_022124 [Daphnia magna]